MANTDGHRELITSVDEIGDRLAERIARAGLEELQLILTTPKHPLRQQYELWLQDYIHRLRNDPALIERVEEFKQQAIDNSTIQTLYPGFVDTNQYRTTHRPRKR